MIKVQLIVVQGRPEGKVIPLSGPVFRIGRDETCHLRPSSEEVSRRHTEITIKPDAAIVADMGSRNGTFVNGRQITAPTELRSGDLIKVGQLTFAVSIQGAPVAVTAAKPPAPAKSLDEVGQEEVASWLISDDNREVPERPSGVYQGDTITMEAYGKTAGVNAPAVQAAPKGSAEAPKAAPAAKPAPAAPKPAPAPAAAPVPPPAPAAAPVPPPAPAAAPVPPPAAAAAPVPPPAPAAAPVPPPAPAAAPAAAASAAATSAPAQKKTKTFWDEIAEFEHLPEGPGDGESAPREPEGETEAGAAKGEEEESESSEPSDEAQTEEWVDESNPFYAAKKKQKQEKSTTKGPASKGPEPAKQSFKDSSEAALAILRKMHERKKGGG